MSYDSDREAAKLAYADNFGVELDEVDDSDFDESYIGAFDSIEDWAQDYIESTGELRGNDLLSRYFDYEAFAHDCEVGGDIWTADSPDGGVFVFHNR